MEMKELYIAPEVEILCFRPMEALASNDSFWSIYGSGSGEGDGNQGEFNSPGTGDTDNDENGDP